MEKQRLENAQLEQRFAEFIRPKHGEVIQQLMEQNRRRAAILSGLWDDSNGEAVPEPDDEPTSTD